MMKLLEFIILPILSLIVLFFLTKLLGYRQVSQLSMYDYIIGITIGSIASELIMKDFTHILKPLIGMIIYALFPYFLSKITYRYPKIRYLVEGRPIVLYENDQIYNNQLKKAKMDLDEFLMQCRINGYFDISQINQVVLETNGTLSFLPKEEYRPYQLGDSQKIIQEKKLPVLLVKEGNVLVDQLKNIGRDRTWLDQLLKVKNISLQHIYLMYYLENSQEIIYELSNEEKDFI